MKPAQKAVGQRQGYARAGMHILREAGVIGRRKGHAIPQSIGAGRYSQRAFSGYVRRVGPVRVQSCSYLPAGQPRQTEDRKSVVSGKSVFVELDHVWSP